jgi:hypothetical protein
MVDEASEREEPRGRKDLSRSRSRSGSAEKEREKEGTLVGGADMDNEGEKKQEPEERRDKEETEVGKDKEKEERKEKKKRMKKEKVKGKEKEVDLQDSSEGEKWVGLSDSWSAEEETETGEEGKKATKNLGLLIPMLLPHVSEKKYQNLFSWLFFGILRKESESDKKIPQGFFFFGVSLFFSDPK